MDKFDLLAEFKAKNDIALLDAYKEIASLKILWRPLIDYLRYYFSYKFGTEPNPNHPIWLSIKDRKWIDLNLLKRSKIFLSKTWIGLDFDKTKPEICRGDEWINVLIGAKGGNLRDIYLFDADLNIIILMIKDLNGILLDGNKFGLLEDCLKSNRKIE